VRGATLRYLAQYLPNLNPIEMPFWPLLKFVELAIKHFMTISRPSGFERALNFAFQIHGHMLRHACGYALANAAHDTRRIQDWLGHRSIQHTTRYTQLSAAPFKDFWR
jgi:integrase